jgi:hypothetical protein
LEQSREKGSELAIISAVVSAVMLATMQLQLIVSLQLLLTHSHFMLWSNRSVAARSGTQSENAEIVSRSLKHEKDALASIDAKGEHVLSIYQHSFAFPPTSFLNFCKVVSAVVTVVARC